MAGPWLTQLAFAVLNILLGMLFVVANTDFCASVFETQIDHALLRHAMDTFTAVDEFQCQLKCMENNSCKSINVHLDGNNAQRRICELNNKTRQMKLADFKRKKGSTYYGSVQASCIDVSREKIKLKKSGECHPGYKGKKCEKQCQDALGMESRAIIDAQITASSEDGAVLGVHAASHARLNFQEIPNKQAGAWVSDLIDVNPWLQVDLGAPDTKVTRVTTQGRNSLNYPQWVTKYKLQYSGNGKAFQYYREPGQDTDKIFDGNTDQDTVVYHALNPLITARYIRFKPVLHHNRVSMRVELYGCLQGI